MRINKGQDKLCCLLWKEGYGYIGIHYIILSLVYILENSIKVFEKILSKHTYEVQEEELIFRRSETHASKANYLLLPLTWR